MRGDSRFDGLGLGLGALAGGIVLLFDPTVLFGSAAGNLLGKGGYIWATLFALGGALMLASVAAASVPLRRLGYAGLGGAFMVAALGIHLSGKPSGVYVTVIFLGLAIEDYGRAYRLRGR